MEDNGVSYYFLECYRKIIFLIHILITHLRWAIIRFTRRNKDTYECLLGKTAIITGGNTGLGYETSLMLASRGCKIIIATNMECESERKKLIEETKNPNIISKYVDLASFSSVRKFAEEIKKSETKIDYLVNIAGIGVTKQIRSGDGLNSIMQINYFGHFLLTHLLVDQLKAAKSARVLFVAAKAAYYNQMKLNDLLEIPTEDQKPTGFQIFNYYGNAKLCIIIAVKELGKRLEKYGITVNSVDPGIFYSNVVQGVFDNDTSDGIIFKVLFRFLLLAYGSDVSEAARNSMYVLTGKNIENGGLYFRCSPNFEPYNLKNQDFCRSIWESSETIVGLKSDQKIV